MGGTGDRALAPNVAELLAGGGELGACMRALDWSATAIGAVETWPQSLRTAVSICLASRFPILIWWGPNLVKLYNDAYRHILGAKHPSALGRPGREVWPEIWDIIGPMLESVMQRGEATWSDDQLLVLDRNGYPEECYFTFSYSPIRDESGGIGGVFTAVAETTERVLGERRTRTLNDLADAGMPARTVEAACQAALETLAANPHDVPFAVLYAVEAGRQQARLVAAAGLAPGLPATPLRVDLQDETASEAIWPLAGVARTNSPSQIRRLQERCGDLPGGVWAVRPEEALVLPVPLPGRDLPDLLLVTAVSPRRALDERYQGFLQLVAGHIGAAVANAHAYEEERARAEALAELDRAKTAFFGNVSHEFRTPLTLLLGPLEEVLGRDGGVSADDRPLLETAHRNALRLLRLVNSLLDFSRIEAGRVQALYEPVDLALLTAELASVFRSAIERAGLRLVVDCPPLPEPVYVDRDMWEKIVLNLLSNALKHTFAGEITVTLRPVDDQVVLDVWDTGTGIPATELPHLFERFHRVRGSRARTHEGSGIGLALVQELVRLHGGEVRVESVEGAGSTFTVTLPRGFAHLPAERLGTAAPAAAPVVAAPVAAAPFVEEALRWLPEWAGGSVAESEPHASSPHLPISHTPHRVLLADDNADMRDYVRRLLSERYEVEAVVDGEAALLAARARPPDLVLADVMMPGLDGLGLLRELRADPGTRTIPVLLLSARAGEESLLDGLAAGADDYLVKPFSARDLVARVQAHLGLGRLREDAAAHERAARAEAERAHAEVEVERARLHTLFQQAPAAICLLSGPNHIYALTNPRYLELIGRRHVLGKSVREVFPELEQQGVLELLDGVYRSGQAFLGDELLIRFDRDQDGVPEVAYFNFVYAPLLGVDGAAEGVFVHAYEVTDQVRARQQLEAERARLRQVLDVLPAGVIIVDSDHRFVMANQAARQILGFDVTGARLPITEAGVHESYGARRLDGSPYPSREMPLQRAVLFGETVRDEQLILRNAVDGRDIPILSNSAPLFDAEGARSGGIIVFQDISVIHDLEQQKDTFLTAVAHDLQQPVTALIGQAQLLLRRLLRDDQPDREYLLTRVASIEDTAKRLGEQATELLDSARLQMNRALDLQLAQIDLVQLVRQSVAEYQRAGDSHQWRVESETPTLLGLFDAARLRRVLDNLLSNAAKFSPAHGEITVMVGTETGDEGMRGVGDDEREVVSLSPSPLISSSPPPRWAVLAVRDRGIGIPAADLPRIFERFYRAGNVAGRVAGTGIGLAGARQIVEQHGGHINVDSAEGEGSTFTIELPLRAQE